MNVIGIIIIMLILHKNVLYDLYINKKNNRHIFSYATEEITYQHHFCRVLNPIHLAQIMTFPPIQSILFFFYKQTHTATIYNMIFN